MHPHKKMFDLTIVIPHNTINFKYITKLQSPEEVVGFSNADKLRIIITL